MNKNTGKTILYVFLIVLAVAVRLVFFDYETLDYLNFLKRWVEFFRLNGGIPALKYGVGNYNIPYQYFLALFSYIPVNDLYLIKALSCVFDFFLAYAAYKLSRKKAAFFIVLFLPSVIINSALWAQCDSIYVSLALLSIVYALDGKCAKSMIFMALSFGFKLQAVFLMPCLVVIWLYKKYSLKYFLVFPLTYLIIILPSILLGHPFIEAFTLYYDQVGTVGSALNYNAPSLTAMASANPTLLTVTAFLAMFAVFLMPKRNRTDVLLLCGIMATVIPFLLPHMHDRYFFATDIFAVILGCMIPVCIPSIIFSQAASLICYHAYLMTHYFALGNYWITNKQAAWAELICLVIFIVSFCKSLLTRIENLV